MRTLCTSSLVVAALLWPGVAARAEPAAPRPALVGRTMLGSPVDLAALRGKVVLVFFWSTDCAVCLDKMPELRRNLEGWRGKDFVIVAVNQDRGRADLAAYEKLLDRLAPPGPQMLMAWRGEPGHRDSFGELPRNRPTTALIDREGRLVKQQPGRLDPQLWDEIAELVLQ